METSSIIAILGGAISVCTILIGVGRVLSQMESLGRSITFLGKQVEKMGDKQDWHSERITRLESTIGGDKK